MAELDENAIDALLKKQEEAKKREDGTAEPEVILDRSHFKKEGVDKLASKLSKSSYKKFKGIKKLFMDPTFTNYDVSFNDFDFTLDLTKEEYEDNKEEYHEYKIAQFNKKTKMYRLAKKECYSFNELARLVIEADDTEERQEDAFLMIENHYAPGRTKYFFVYRSAGEYIDDFYDTEVSSVFFEKDVQKIQFLIKYTMNTIDRAFIMSDEIYNFESPYLAQRGIFFTKYGTYDLVKKLKPFAGASVGKAIGLGLLIFILMVGMSAGGAFFAIMDFQERSEKSIKKLEKDLSKVVKEINKTKQLIISQEQVLGGKKELYYDENDKKRK
jgi:hypothetical protein